MIRQFFLLTIFIVTSHANESEPRNAIDFHPVQLASGFSGGYCRLLSNNVALQLEGSAFLWDITGQNSSGWRLYLGVPIHFHPREHLQGMDSPFIMPLIRYELSKTILTSDRETYNYSTGNYQSSTDWGISALSVGVSIGRRWIFKKCFTIGVRGGYCVYPYFKSTWGANPDIFTYNEKESFERKGKIISGVDALLKIGGTF